MSRTLLFVHDDPAVLSQLRASLAATPGEWASKSCSTPAEALAVLERMDVDRIDAVLASADLRVSPSTTLLSEIARLYPRVVRVVVSASAGRGLLLRAAGAAHQQLDPGVDARALFARLPRTFAIGDLLHDSRLRGLVSRLKSVPSLPSSYLAIMAELRQGEASPRKVGDLVARDPSMAAKVLQLVNSPFFGFRMTVADPAHAVQLLGLETVRGLVLSLHLFGQLDERVTRRFQLGKVWRHSMATTAFARLIARLQDASPEALAASFTAALLHDIGKLVMATSIPEEYAAALDLAQRDTLPQWLAELRVMDTTHAEVGAYLLSMWGLPENIVEAVAWHHHPADCLSPTFCPLGAVHVANAIEHDIHPDNLVGAAPGVDEEYLTRLGLNWQYSSWRSACLDAEGEGLGRGLGARL